MKIEGFLFAFVGVFLIIADVVYWYTSHDPTGTTALALAAGLGFLVAFYALFTARRIDARPEDRRDADITDGAGEIGFYSPHSWWPLIAAASAAIVSLGFVFSIWIAIMGGVFLIAGALGFLFEYYDKTPAAKH